MSANRQQWFLGSGVISALAASLCCVGPAVMVALGLGGIAVFSWFAEYRPWFIGLTIVFLSIAWWLALRPPGACKPGAACANSGKSRRTTLILLSVATLAATGFAVYPWIAGNNANATVTSSQAQTNALPINSRTASFAIPSMDCAACATGIAKVLRKEPGVFAATVTYDTKTAEIVYDPSVTASEKLAAAIAETGFPPEPTNPDQS